MNGIILFLAIQIVEIIFELLIYNFDFDPVPVDIDFFRGIICFVHFRSGLCIIFLSFL